jgi:predicted nucleic acid-binding protein
MSRCWVVNASPLILLGKAHQLHLLRRLTDELIVPEAVAQEVRAKPEGRDLLDALIDPPVVRIEKCTVPMAIEVWDLGRGESEVLAQAMSRGGGCRAVVDDLEARRCAQTFEIRVIGTLGIILRAKHKGLIPAARPVLDELRGVGLYVSDALVEKALRHLNE